MVEKAREVVGHRADYRVADIRALPFEDESFDGVVANHMLYHVPDRPQALAEIRRVLRSAGRVFATTNGGDHLQEIKAFYERPASIEFRIEDAGDELGEFFVGCRARSLSGRARGDGGLSRCSHSCAAWITGSARDGRGDRR